MQRFDLSYYIYASINICWKKETKKGRKKGRIILHVNNPVVTTRLDFSLEFHCQATDSARCLRLEVPQASLSPYKTYWILVPVFLLYPSFLQICDSSMLFISFYGTPTFLFISFVIAIFLQKESPELISTLTAVHTPDDSSHTPPPSRSFPMCPNVVDSPTPVILQVVSLLWPTSNCIMVLPWVSAHLSHLGFWTYLLYHL